MSGQPASSDHDLQSIDFTSSVPSPLETYVLVSRYTIMGTLGNYSMRLRARPRVEAPCTMVGAFGGMMASCSAWVLSSLSLEG